jgi:hypothetical protein
MQDGSNGILLPTRGFVVKADRDDNAAHSYFDPVAQGRLYLLPLAIFGGESAYHATLGASHQRVRMAADDIARSIGRNLTHPKILSAIQAKTTVTTTGTKIL